MCNIWQLPRDEFMLADDYRNLPASLRNVNITGGEPLLRPDVIEIVHAIYESSGRPRIILATNGFRPEKTVQQVLKMRYFAPDLGVAISLDGLGEQHDHIRGVAHAYSRATQTIKGLADAGVKDLRIGFTATVDNIDQLISIYDLARDLHVEFTATIAQESETYYAIKNLPTIAVTDVTRNFAQLIDRQLGSPTAKDWLRAYFSHGVIHFAQQRRRMRACSAATEFFFLSPQGDVYPCLTLPEKIGNLREQSFESIWNSQRAQDVATQAAQCQSCWMMCTARTELKKSPLRAASWVLRNKLARHIGLGASRT